MKVCVGADGRLYSHVLQSLIRCEFMSGCCCCCMRAAEEESGRRCREKCVHACVRGCVCVGGVLCPGSFSLRHSPETRLKKKKPFLLISVIAKYFSLFTMLLGIFLKKKHLHPIQFSWYSTFMHTNTPPKVHGIEKYNLKIHILHSQISTLALHTIWNKTGVMHLHNSKGSLYPIVPP